MQRRARRFATDLLTGPVGRVTALVADVSILSAHYFAARLRGRRPDA